MKILTIHTSYNELPLLQYKYEHCRQNGIDLYVIDNMSNDGTEEFLNEKNIPRSFVDTNNAFDLRPLLYAMDRKIHELKPDWFIYSGVDMFPEAPEGIRNMIEAADRQGFTQIQMKQYIFRYTGEHKPGNPFANYFYYNHAPEMSLITKYDRSVVISPDRVTRENIVLKRDAGIFFEMHASKLPEERMETLRRREAAWKNGMNRGWGHHYPAEAKINFTYRSTQCLDIRRTQDFFMYSRLQKIKTNELQLSGARS